MKKLIEHFKVVAGLAPSVDRYDTSPTTICVSLRIFQRALFILRQKTAGTNTGTATITMEACSDKTGTGATAIPFDYYKNEAVATSDAYGALISATASGFVTTANKDAIYAVEVRASDLPRGKPFLRMKLTETVNDPVAGDVIVIMGEGQEGSPDDIPTAIA